MGVASAEPVAQHEDPTVLVFSKTAGFRHDSIPAGIAAIQALGATERLRASRPPRTRARSRPRTCPTTPPSSSCRPPATSSNAEQQTAFESYIDGRRRLRGRARRGRHRVRLALVRPARRRLVQVAPGHPAGQRARRRATTTRPPRPAGRLDAHRRVVQLPDQPADRGEGARHAGRVQLRRRAATRWATTRSCGVTRRAPAGPGTPAAATPSSPTASRSSSTTSRAASRTRPAWRRPTARRTTGPAEPPVDADFDQITLAKGEAGHRRADRAGRAARPPGHPHLARRPRLADHAGGDDHARRRRSRSTTTTRTACRAWRSTRTSPRTSGCTSTTRRRWTRRPATRRRTAPRRTSSRSRATTSCPASSSPTRARSTWPASSRSCRSPPTAASAATSGGEIDFDAGGQPAPVHRGRHQPVRVRRLHPDRRAGGPQPGLRRAAHLGQHQRPARQAPADHRGRRRQLHGPRGQPVRAGHREDPPGDLRDGLPQPVPVRRRQADRLDLPRRLRSGRRRGQPGPRSGRHGRVQPDQGPGQLRLAATASATTSRSSTTTSPPARPARRSTARRRRTRARTTRAWSTCRRCSRRGSRTTAARCPSSAPAASRRWAARSTTTTPNLDVADEVPGVLRRQELRLRVGPRLDQDDRRSARTASAARSSRSSTRWT